MKGPPYKSQTRSDPRLQRGFWPTSELGFRRLQRWHQHLSDIARRLIEVEAHPLGAEVLADNVELNARASSQQK
jgi:hypothetical protein